MVSTFGTSFFFSVTASADGVGDVSTEEDDEEEDDEETVWLSRGGALSADSAATVSCSAWEPPPKNSFNFPTTTSVPLLRRQTPLRTCQAFILNSAMSNHFRDGDETRLRKHQGGLYNWVNGTGFSQVGHSFDNTAEIRFKDVLRITTEV